MSFPLTRFGAIVGIAGGDARIRIGGKGRKNVLTITVGWQRSTAVAPATSFQGRLVILEGQLEPLGNPNFTPSPADYPNSTDFYRLGKVLYDTYFSDVGPHPLFLPIAQQEGSPQSDEDSTINIIACIGIDGAAGVYVPSLTVSGQTVFGGNTAGQQTFAGGIYS